MKSLKEKLIDTAGGYSFITVTSDSCVRVEGCRQILECDDILVRLTTDRFLIDIWGEALKVTSFNSSSVEASGTIRNIELTRKKKSGVK